MEVNNEADKIKRKISLKNLAMFLLFAVAVGFFIYVGTQYESASDKLKTSCYITIAACVVIILIIVYTQKKDRKDLEEANKYFYGDNDANNKANDPLKRNSLEELRKKTKTNNAKSILGDSYEENISAETFDKQQEEKHKDTENSNPLGEFKFVPPGEKNKPKEQYKFKTNIRANGSTFGTTDTFGSSVLDRFK